MTALLSSPLRKLTLTAHVACSVAALGAVAVFLVLAVAGLASADDALVRAAYVAMNLAAWSIILPLVGAALLTGLVQALGTPWGLLQHYWVLIKLVMTVLILAVLLIQMRQIGELADAAAGGSLALGDLLRMRMSVVLHAAGGLAALLVPTALSIYKPGGMTPYGLKKLQSAR